MNLKTSLQVVFDEADEVDPCSQQDESDNEANGETNGAPVEKLFKCDYCAYKSSAAVLIKHHIVRAHTRNIAYVCSLCVYECRWNRDYYEHMKTHFPVCVSRVTDLRVFLFFFFLLRLVVFR